MSGSESDPAVRHLAEQLEAKQRELDALAVSRPAAAADPAATWTRFTRWALKHGRELARGDSTMLRQG